MIKKRNQTGNSVEAYACACLYASIKCMCTDSCNCDRTYVYNTVMNDTFNANGSAVYNEYNFRSQIING